jgi:hypothetical protein
MRRVLAPFRLASDLQNRFSTAGNCRGVRQTACSFSPIAYAGGRAGMAAPEGAQVDAQFGMRVTYG